MHALARHHHAAPPPRHERTNERGAGGSAAAAADPRLRRLPLTRSPLTQPTARTHDARRYLKYLTKKYLKKHNVSAVLLGVLCAWPRCTHSSATPAGHGMAAWNGGMLAWNGGMLHEGWGMCAGPGPGGTSSTVHAHKLPCPLGSPAERGWRAHTRAHSVWRPVLDLPQLLHAPLHAPACAANGGACIARCRAQGTVQAFALAAGRASLLARMRSQAAALMAVSACLCGMHVSVPAQIFSNMLQVCSHTGNARSLRMAGR